MTWLTQTAGVLRRTVLSALAHDSLHLAQSCAYLAIVAVFPGLIVTATLLSWLPVFQPVQIQVAAFFDQVLPASVFPLLTSYFSTSPHPHTAHLVIAATAVSVSGASSVIATLMEGLRRAEGLSDDSWNFLQRRGRALLLVPLSFIPLGVATAAVMFGELIAGWLADSMYHSIKPIFFLLSEAVRWALALAAVAAVTAMLYHWGTPPEESVKPTELKAQSEGEEQPSRRKTQWKKLELLQKSLYPVPFHPRRGWRDALPGAVFATLVWFVSTLVFGWYVTRLANYNQVYGPLGAGIALLFWLYIVFLSVLFGAEFNAQFRRRASVSLPADESNLID